MLTTRRYYLVMVHTDSGWFAADGLNPVKHRDIMIANRACRQYQKKYPTSTYRVITVTN